MDEHLTFVRANYELHDWRHAVAILSADFTTEWADMLAVLSDFRLRRSHILQPGGSNR